MPFNPESVQELRTRERMSKLDLANILDVTRTTINNYETGKSNPPLNTLDKLYQFAIKRGHKDLTFYLSPE